MDHGATVDLEFAAGLGRVDLLPGFFDAEGALLPSAGCHHPPTPQPVAPDDAAGNELIEQALVYAAINGRTEAVRYLLDRGADVNATPSGFTHRLSLPGWGKGHPDMVDLLVARGADRPGTSPPST